MAHKSIDMEQLTIFDEIKAGKTRGISAGVKKFLEEYIMNPFNFSIHLRINMKANSHNYACVHYYEWIKPNGYCKPDKDNAVIHWMDSRALTYASSRRGSWMEDRLTDAMLRTT